MIRDLHRADSSPDYALLSSAVLSQFKDGLKDAKGSEAHTHGVDHCCGPPASEKHSSCHPWQLLQIFA